MGTCGCPHQHSGSLLEARRLRPCPSSITFDSLLYTALFGYISALYIFFPHGPRVHPCLFQTSGYNTGAAQGGAVKVSASGGDGTIEQLFREGDGAYISGTTGKEIKVENVGDSVAEVLLFDLE